MVRLLLVIVSLLVATSLYAQTSTPTLYITPMEDGFETYITAAMHKKNVPILVTTNQEGATYMLKASTVEVSKESGAGKIARCLFAYCIGIADSSSTSVSLVAPNGTILWSYAVKKGKGNGNRQSMAEAIAKHFHNDYLKKRS